MDETGSKPSVLFLSHAVEDEREAFAIRDIIKMCCGLSDEDIFMFQNIDLGEVNWDVINQKLNECKFFVLLWSKNYLKKQNTSAESGWASISGKPSIFPLFLDKTNPQNMPADISRLNGKKVFQPVDFSNALKILRTVLNGKPNTDPVLLKEKSEKNKTNPRNKKSELHDDFERYIKSGLIDDFIKDKDYILKTDMISAHYDLSSAVVFGLLEIYFEEIYRKTEKCLKFFEWYLLREVEGTL